MNANVIQQLSCDDDLFLVVSYYHHTDFCVLFFCFKIICAYCPPLHRSDPLG